MTPEELDCIRATIAAGIPMDSSELGRMLLEHIDSQAEEIVRANHRYADLQNICDDQDKEIKRLEAENYQWRSYNHELGNKSHKQRLALKKLGEKVRAKRRAWREEQKWHDIDLGRVKRLEEKYDAMVRSMGRALVEERARRLIAAGAECFFRTPIKGSILSKCDKGIYCDWTTCPIKDEKRQDAREQLRAEGVIR